MDTTTMTDAEYRAHKIIELARDCADSAWRAGLARLVEEEGLEYHQCDLTALDVAWVEGEEECRDLTSDELRRATEAYRDRIADLHAGNGDYE